MTIRGMVIAPNYGQVGINGWGEGMVFGKLPYCKRNVAVLSIFFRQNPQIVTVDRSSS
jgi:hypothetical protein